MSLALGATLLLAPVVASAVDWRSDLIEVRDGRFVYRSTSLCRVTLPDRAPSRFLVASYAEAPAEGVISRDRFVALILSVEDEYFITLAERSPGLTASAFSEHLRCDEVPAPEGSPDLSIRLVATKTGYLLEVVEGGKTRRQSRSWEE